MVGGVPPHVLVPPPSLVAVVRMVIALPMVTLKDMADALRSRW